MRGRGYSHHALEVAILPPEDIRQRIHRGDHVLVAEMGGTISGTATGIEEHETLHVCSVAVDPACWGQGIGRQLMRALEDIAGRQKCRKLWLQTAWSMTEAIGLYERVGFVQEGYQPCQFYGEDFLLFGKILHRDGQSSKRNVNLS
jgi:ribosomal protein S18 acetylase RimI-like enzyme